MRSNVPEAIRNEIVRKLFAGEMKPRHAVEYIKEKHGFDVTKAQVNGWRSAAIKLKREASQPFKAERLVPLGTPPINPPVKPIAFEDGCMMSYRPQRAAMKEAAEPFTCALSLNVLCSGSVGNKKKCPLWSGSARVF